MNILERVRMGIKKGDMVEVIAGKSKGHRGRIKQVIPLKNRVVVEGANFIKKITRPSMKRPRREVIELEAPLHRSNVMLVCPNCKQPTRIAHKSLPNGKKVRSCNKCGEFVDKV